MKTIRICSVIVLALTLAACPAEDREAEVAAGDLLEGDTVVPATEPVTVAPGQGAMAAERVDLGEMNNSGVTGDAVLTPMDNQLEVVLTVRGATPNSRLEAHIHRGRCDSQGPVAAPLEAVTTDNTGTGSSRTVVSQAPMTIMDGQHYVQAHTPGGDPGPPVTCGNIPEHQM